MENGMRGKANQPGRSFFVVLLLVACCIGAIHCSRPESGNPVSPTVQVNTVTRNGYTIQLFPAAEDQLRHAQGWFSDPKEKKAALEVLIQVFPDDKVVRAEAELELAYIALGSDYRFATPDECRSAIDKYHRILKDYAHLPDVSAKANWYIGWILADLLNEPRKAAVYYQTVVDRYPKATLSLKSPVPWVSLVLPQVEDRPKAVYQRPIYYWASLALLELVRNSEDADDALIAFKTLYTDFRGSQATGYAIRDLLKDRQNLVGQIAPYAKEYLEAKLFTRSMEKEVRELLGRMGTRGRGAE